LIGEGVYLRTYLAPLAPWLDRIDVTDILVNQPGEVWIDGASGFERIETPDVTEVMLQRLAQQIAAHSSQGVSREYPLLAATLPDGARVQVVAPPATRKQFALAIRKHVLPDLRLVDYEKAGAFAQVSRAAGSERAATDAELNELLEAGNLLSFFSRAVKARRNIVISGGTGTGKTTFLNALLKEIPEDSRLIVIDATL
jgi:type IV secretion system protein VirB11